MSKSFKHYKRIFRNNLQPNLAVLLAKRNEMQEEEWEVYVRKTTERIRQNPIEFLGADLPSESLISDILDEIEKEFIKETQIVRRKSSSEKLVRNK